MDNVRIYSSLWSERPDLRNHRAVGTCLWHVVINEQLTSPLQPPPSLSQLVPTGRECVGKGGAINITSVSKGLNYADEGNHVGTCLRHVNHVGSRKCLRGDCGSSPQ